MRRPLLFLAVLALLFLTGCQARTTVDVDVEANGSGAVTVDARLDEEAMKSVPNLADQLRTSDLAAAGWSVDEPEQLDDGGALVRVRHGFDSVGEANALLRQLGDAFRDFRIEQDTSLTNVDTRFSGTVDLTKGIDSFGDETLRQRAGAPLGFDSGEVQRNLGVDWAATFPVDLVVHLPGDSRSSVPATGEDHVWHLNYGTVTQLQAFNKGPNIWPMVFFGLALATVVAAVIVSLVWRTYRPQHRKKSGGIRARDLLAQTAG